MNLLDLLKDQIGSTVVNKAAEYLGESTSSTQSALGSIMPAVLGGVINQASTTDGVKGLMGLFSKGSEHTDLLGNLGNMLGQTGGFDKILNMGGPIIKMLFGNKTEGVFDMISNAAGVKKSSASGLMSLVAPVVMGLLSKKVSSEGLGISGLANFLMGQAGSIKSALPAGFASQLGFSNLGDFLGDNKGGAAPSGSTGGFGKFAPWLLGLLGLLLALYFLKNCNKTEATDAANTAVENVTESATEVVDAGKTAVQGFVKTLSSGFALANAKTDGIESQLISFIEDASKPVDKTTWFNFDQLLFETGKATLMPESEVQLKNIAEILKAFPKVKIKVGAYTDNVGNPASNLKLSSDRAANVMNALVGLGIEKTRLTAEGYGQEHPVCPANDTEECKQQNRRVAVRVTEK